MADKNLTLPPPDSDSGVTFTWQELAMILMRRRRLIVRVMLACAVLLSAAVLLHAPTYTAVSTLEMKPRVVDTPVSPETDTASIAARGNDYQHMEAEINSAVTLLSSPALLRAALESAKAKRGAEPEPSAFVRAIEKVADAAKGVLALPSRIHDRIYGVAPPSEMDRLLAEALQELTVMPVESSRLIQIWFRSEDPRWSADVANGLGNALLNPRVRSQAARESLRFVRRQRELLESRFIETQGDVRDFRQREGADLAFANEAELRTVRLELHQSKARTDAELSEVNAGMAALDHEIENLPKNLPVSAQVEQTQPVTTLMRALAQLEMERSQLAGVYAPGSRAMIDVEKRLKTVKQLLANERGAAAARFHSGGTEIQAMRLKQIESRTRKAELEARTAALTSEIDRHTKMLDRMDAIAAENRRLDGRLTTAQEAYFTYLKKEEEARFAAALDDASIANLVVASAATIPPAPDPSADWLLFVVGLCLSFGAAACVAFVADRLDPSLKSAAEAFEVTSYPVLGTFALEYAGPAALTAPRSRFVQLPFDGRRRHDG